MLAKYRPKLVLPTGKNRAVAPVRRPNTEYRKRERLTPSEVAKHGRRGTARRPRAAFERAAEHVTRRAPATASVAAFIPQHGRLRIPCLQASPDAAVIHSVSILDFGSD